MTPPIHPLRDQQLMLLVEQFCHFYHYYYVTTLSLIEDHVTSVKLFDAEAKVCTPKHIEEEFASPLQCHCIRVQIVL